MKYKNYLEYYNWYLEKKFSVIILETSIAWNCKLKYCFVHEWKRSMKVVNLSKHSRNKLHHKWGGKLCEAYRYFATQGYKLNKKLWYECYFDP